jgi:type VI secretion system protein ImpL
MAIVDKTKTAVRSPYFLVAAGIVLAILLAAALAFALAKLGLFTALESTRWLPEILVIVAVIVLLLILFVGLPKYRERSFVQRLESGYRVGGEQSPQEFQAKFAAALRRFRNLPQNAGKGDSTYALPWFLMIGLPASGKTDAIKASGIFSALTTTTLDGPTQNCDWWVSNSMLLLDSAGRYAIPADLERDRGEWYRLLRLIKHYHSREPLSGMVVAVAANYLASQPDENLHSDASQVRERIEEAIQQVGVDFPVYLLVTKCDLVEGFAEFFGTLPVRVLNQAVGWVDDPPAGRPGGPARGAAAIKRLQEGLQTSYQRFSSLGTSVLDGSSTEGLRRPLFCFPEEFCELTRRLSAFLEVLAGEDVRYHTPLVRGVFLSSTPRPGPRTSFLRKKVGIASQPATSDTKVAHYFLRELFETILPRDRALARSAATKTAA